MLVECKLVQPLWKIVCNFLSKTEINLPHDPAIPWLGIYPQRHGHIVPKRYLHHHAYSSIVHNSWNWEWTKVYFTRWISKENFSSDVSSQVSRAISMGWGWVELGHYNHPNINQQHKLIYTFEVKFVSHLKSIWNWGPFFFLCFFNL